MATPSDSLPFELSIRQLPVGTFWTADRTVFTEDEQQLAEMTAIPAFEIKENHRTEVLFNSSDDGAQFIIDGFDALEEGKVNFDGKTQSPYLRPSHQAAVIFDAAHDVAPFIPGLNLLCVQAAGRTFYAWYKVLASRLDESDWQTMIAELEAEVRGLSLASGRRILAKEGIAGSSDQEIFFTFILDRFDQLAAALHDLERKAAYQIKKSHVIRPASKVTMTDELSIRGIVSRPDRKERMMQPVKVYHYDLPENRFAKSIILMIMSRLSDFARAGTRKDQLEKARQMRSRLSRFLSSDWLRSTSDTPVLALPQSMVQDPRYRVLYNTFRGLKQSAGQAPDRLSIVSMKRTDKLYEYWCFLQVLEALQHPALGFSLQGGTLFGESSGTGRTQAMQPGGYVALSGHGLYLHLIYDAVLPSRPAPSSPLYTLGSANRPDARLDVYKGGIYHGSLIIDMKYRPEHSIWEDKRITDHRRTKAMHQLISYYADTRSVSAGVPKGERLAEGVSAVPEVWAFHPGGRHSQETYDPDYHVRLLPLAPSRGHDAMQAALNRVVTRII